MGKLGLCFHFAQLVILKLESLPVRDSAFSQAANLHRLTCLEFGNCFELSDNVFLHLAGLVSLRHLHIRSCIKISEKLDVKTLLRQQCSLPRTDRPNSANGTQAH